MRPPGRVACFGFARHGHSCERSENKSRGRIKMRNSFHPVMLSKAKRSRNTSHKLTGDPSTTLRVTE